MKPGYYYRVGAVADKSSSIKLVCLGIVPGKVIKLIRRAPLGGGYYISCDDKRVGIASKELASLKLVEVNREETSKY